MSNTNSLRELAERAVVALHMHGHAGIRKANFTECREGLCKDWHELSETQVEQLRREHDELNAKLDQPPDSIRTSFFFRKLNQRYEKVRERRDQLLIELDQLTESNDEHCRERDEAKCELAGYKMVVGKCWDLAKDYIAQSGETFVDFDFVVGKMLRELTVGGRKIERLESENKRLTEELAKLTAKHERDAKILLACQTALRQVHQCSATWDAPEMCMPTATQG